MVCNTYGPRPSLGGAHFILVRNGLTARRVSQPAALASARLHAWGMEARRISGYRVLQGGVGRSGPKCVIYAQGPGSSGYRRVPAATPGPKKARSGPFRAASFGDFRRDLPRLRDRFPARFGDQSAGEWREVFWGCIRRRIDCPAGNLRLSIADFRLPIERTENRLRRMPRRPDAVLD